MALTSSQYAALKTSINADATFNGWLTDPEGSVRTDNAYEIARRYNLNASPNFTVWKTMLSITEIGNAFVGSELAGLTTGNQTRLQTIAQYSAGGINPTLADRRAFFDDVFSGAGGTATRAKLLILYKRLATRAEKLYATGTGSDAVPATLVFEGQISGTDVALAWEFGG